MIRVLRIITSLITIIWVLELTDKGLDDIYRNRIATFIQNNLTIFVCFVNDVAGRVPLRYVVSVFVLLVGDRSSGCSQQIYQILQHIICVVIIILRKGLTNRFLQSVGDCDIVQVLPAVEVVFLVIHKGIEVPCGCSGFAWDIGKIAIIGLITIFRRQQ